MTDGNRRHCNARLRAKIDEILSRVPAGDEIRTDHVARILQATHKSIDMSTRRAGTLIRERNDVRHVADGVWEKVSV